jgi:hypothetical protein
LHIGTESLEIQQSAFRLAGTGMFSNTDR